jgi:ribosome biogenesis protein YTM1
MQIHKQPATAAIFDPGDRTVGYSASCDHTVRTIDLTTSTVVSTLATTHPLHSLCALPRSGGGAPLLAAGTAARHITLLDPRAGTSATSVLTLRGHANVAHSLAASPHNEHSLVSGSADGTCRVWDLRSVRPATRDEGGLGGVCEAAFVIERQGAAKGRKRDFPGDGCRVFSVVWDKQLGIVSGGEDKRVEVHSAVGVVGS